MTCASDLLQRLSINWFIAAASFSFGSVAEVRDDFGKLAADETEKWAKVIKFAGIRPE